MEYLSLKLQDILYTFALTNALTKRLDAIMHQSILIQFLTSPACLWLLNLIYGQQYWSNIYDSGFDL